MSVSTLLFNLVMLNGVDTAQNSLSRCRAQEEKYWIQQSPTLHFMISSRSIRREAHVAKIRQINPSFIKFCGDSKLALEVTKIDHICCVCSTVTVLYSCLGIIFHVNWLLSLCIAVKARSLVAANFTQKMFWGWHSCLHEAVYSQSPTCIHSIYTCMYACI